MFVRVVWSGREKELFRKIWRLFFAINEFSCKLVSQLVENDNNRSNRIVSKDNVIFSPKQVYTCLVPSFASFTAAAASVNNKSNLFDRSKMVRMKTGCPLGLG